MKTVSVTSPVKVITSGTAPTTANLLKGQFAYGTIGGKLRYYGNVTGSAIVELTAKEYTALTSGGITVSAAGEISITAAGVTETMLAAALATKINNVLQKNNTTTFTPTGDYNPATKKYVDDAMQVAMEVANGSKKAIVFDTKAQLDSWLAGTYTSPSGYVKADLQVGDDLYIIDQSSSDYWWDGTNIQQLDVKVDLTNYYTKTQADGAISTAVNGISKTLTAAASQKVSIAGTMSAVTATINAAAAVSGGGLMVTSGALEIDTANLQVTLAAVEI
jgi:hypothetical protein